MSAFGPPVGRPEHISHPASGCQQGGAGRASVRDSRIIFYGCTLLLAGYCLLLSRLWALDGTLFGHKDIPGLDFAMFWAAGRLALAGRAAAAYDSAMIYDFLNSFFGEMPTRPVTMFLYPPWFLVALAPLGLLPFATAAGIWLATTLAAYLAAARAIMRGGSVLVAALAAPAVFFNLLPGQNGLLTAGLIGGGLALLDTAPISAGILIGLIAYKPQFGVLLALFLPITGRWRVVVCAAVTVAVLVGASSLLFGADTFAAFVRAAPNLGEAFAPRVQAVDGQFTRPHWADLTSVYSMFRAAGFGSMTAWCGHILAAAAAASASLWFATSGARADLKAAAIATAAFVFTPYAEYYDLAILTVPIAFLVRDGLSQGLRRSEWAALSAVYLLPLLYIASYLMRWPWHNSFTWVIGPLMCAVLAVVIGRRVLVDPGKQTLTRK